MPLAVVTCLLGGYALQQLFTIFPERHLKKLRCVVILGALALPVSGIRYNRCNPYLEAASVIHKISPRTSYILTNTNLDRCRYYMGHNVQIIPANISLEEMEKLISQQVNSEVFILLQGGSEVWQQRLQSAKSIELLDEFKGKKGYYRLYKTAS